MGGSSSKQETSSTTEIQSTTTTAVDGTALSFSGGMASVGDIGLTGKDAVALATTIGQSQHANFATLIQGAGEAYNQLIGGANNLIQTGAQQTAISSGLVSQLAASASGEDSAEERKERFMMLAIALGGAAALVTIVNWSNN